MVDQTVKAVFTSPCAACKVLRRRCTDKCVLAPYFPQDNLQNFVAAHRLFGASNIIKMLQNVPTDQRYDAVSSMVYEATARRRDPVYGCAGVICQLQQQISELQSQLAAAQELLLNLRSQQANYVAFMAGFGSQSDEAGPFCPYETTSGGDNGQLRDLPSDELDRSIWGYK